MDNFFNTTEASERWGISARRITQLAAAGRIKGAVLVGKTWLIPVNAQKPVDGRTKEQRGKTDRYIFPYPVAGLTSEKHLPVHYSDEEKELCRAQLFYESGDFSESKKICKKLLAESRNKYICLGASFTMIYISIMLREFAAAQKFLLEFRVCASDPDPHGFELELLLGELDATFSGGSSLLKNYQLRPVNNYSKEASVYLIPFASCVDFFHVLKKKDISTTSYELLSYQVDSTGNFFASVFLHLYIAVFYIKTDVDSAFRHLRLTVDQAVRNNFITSVSRMLALDPSSMEQLISPYPADVQQKFRELAQTSLSAFNDFYVFLGKTDFYKALTTEDYHLLSLIMREQTYTLISENLQISEATVKRRVAALCRKFNVNNRAELYELYVKTLMDTDTR